MNNSDSASIKMLVPIFLGITAVAVLVFGTRRTVQDVYVDDRPAELGGERANTGEIVDWEDRRTLHSEPAHEEHAAVHSDAELPGADGSIGWTEHSDIDDVWVQPVPRDGWSD